MCILYGILDILSRYKRLNQNNAFCFRFILMADFSTILGCWHNLQLFISGLFMYGYPSNFSCNKSCDICKTKCMVIKLILMGYVNNNDKNRYLKKNESSCILDTHKVKHHRYFDTKTGNRDYIRTTALERSVMNY